MAAADGVGTPLAGGFRLLRIITISISISISISIISISFRVLL